MPPPRETPRPSKTRLRQGKVTLRLERLDPADDRSSRSRPEEQLLLPMPEPGERRS